MAIRFYDKAIADKLSSWLSGKKVTILKPEESTRFFEMTLDQMKDKPIAFPLISISRDKDIEILNTQKQSKTFNGFILNKFNYWDLANGKGKLNTSGKDQIIESGVAVPINVIPIRIGYQIDIYTKRIVEADEYLRNFIFNFINYPRLEIELPYNNIKINHESNIKLESTISDNSDIKEHLFPDQFVRFTLKITINDAYLFSLPEKKPFALDVDLVVQDIRSLEVVEPWLSGSGVKDDPLIFTNFGKLSIDINESTDDFMYFKVDTSKNKNYHLNINLIGAESDVIIKNTDTGEILSDNTFNVSDSNLYEVYIPEAILSENVDAIRYLTIDVDTNLT